MNSKLESNFPTSGKAKLLTILVEFRDKKFNTSVYDVDALEYFTAFSMEEGFAGNGSGTALKTGSMRDYYLENSDSILDLEIDVYGPFTLPGNSSVYAKDLYQMVEDACKAADAAVPFSDYDMDNNGVVDAIHFIFAGHSQAESNEPNDIWPQRAQFPNTSLSFDGKKVSDFFCSSEFSGRTGTTKAGIGTSCHEFGHILGLPDFYDTNYDNDGKPTAFTMHRWSLMNQGNYLNNGNTPPALIAIEKEMLGWHSHTELNDPGFYNLGIWGADNDAKSYKITTHDENEYFVLENRQKKEWDSYIPASGMLIYYYDKRIVDRWFDYGLNNINANPDTMGCFIVCADNRRGDNTLQGDPFPGSTNRTSFTDNSTPSSMMALLRYSNEPLLKPIEFIEQLADSTIQFAFKFNVISHSGVACDNLATNTAPIIGNEFDSCTYLWEVLNNTTNVWESAPGANTETNYQITSITDFVSLRRIATYNTQNYASNTVTIRISPSNGGLIFPEQNSITIGKQDTLVLSGFNGNIIHWETKFNDEEWSIIENTAPILFNIYEASGIYKYRAVVQNADCDIAYSEESTITVTPKSTDTPYSLGPTPPEKDGLVTLYSKNSDPYDVNIFSSFGKLVYSEKGINTSAKIINVSALQGGVYIVQFINTKDNSVYNQKVIIGKREK